MAEFRATAAAAGKDLSGFAWCAQRRLSIGETLEEARGNVEWMAREQADMWKYAGYMHDQGEAATAAHSAMVAIGTEDAIRDNIRSYIDAGADHIDVTFIYPTYASLVRQIDLFAERVLPAFR